MAERMSTRLHALFASADHLPKKPLPPVTNAMGMSGQRFCAIPGGEMVRKMGLCWRRTPQYEIRLHWVTTSTGVPQMLCGPYLAPCVIRLLALDAWDSQV